MNTVEDFKNAPLGATATLKATGIRATKMGGGERSWVFSRGSYTSDEQMAYWGYTLDQPTPTTAREAIDLAWELAHEVKEGQVIPADTGYLGDHGNGIKEYVTHIEFKIGPGRAHLVRTMEPLPDPKPYWHDAPAVIAVCNDNMDRDVFVRRGDNSWVSEFYGAGTHDLRDVTPLYPLNEGTMNGTEAPKGYTPSGSMGLKNEGTDA